MTLGTNCISIRKKKKLEKPQLEPWKPLKSEIMNHIFGFVVLYLQAEIIVTHEDMMDDC